MITTLPTARTSATSASASATSASGCTLDTYGPTANFLGHYAVPTLAGLGVGAVGMTTAAGGPHEHPGALITPGGNHSVWLCAHFPSF